MLKSYPLVLEIGEATFELVKLKVAVLFFSKVAMPPEVVYLGERNGFDL